MRKLLSCCLLFFLIWQIVGFTAYFEFSRYHLKKEIKLLLKQSVPKDELVIFEMTDKEMNNLIWLKKNEFSLNGNLFDVVRAHRTNDNKMYMECISDKKESDLFKNLGQNITNNLADENNSNPISSLTKIIQIPAISESLKIEVYLEKSILENTVRSFFSYSKNTSSLSKVVDSPPPQLVS